MSKPVAAIVIAIFSFSSNSLKKNGQKKAMYFPLEGEFRVGFQLRSGKEKSTHSRASYSGRSIRLKQVLK
jgi:hypothetical protein